MKAFRVFAIGLAAMLIAACSNIPVVPNIVQENDTAFGLYGKTNPDSTLGGGFGWLNHQSSLIPGLNNNGTPVTITTACGQEQLSALILSNTSVNDSLATTNGLTALFGATAVVADGRSANNTTDAIKLLAAQGQSGNVNNNSGGAPTGWLEPSQDEDNRPCSAAK